MQLRGMAPNGKYSKNQGQLIMLDLPTGQVRWSRPMVYPYGQSGVYQEGDFLSYNDGRKNVFV